MYSEAPVTTFNNTLTEKEAADYLGTSLSTLRRRRSARREPAFIQFDRSIRYRRETLEKFLDDHTHEPGEPNGDKPDADEGEAGPDEKQVQ